jgi:hypothetical protein
MCICYCSVYLNIIVVRIDGVNECRNHCTLLTFNKITEGQESTTLCEVEQTWIWYML